MRKMTQKQARSKILDTLLGVVVGDFVGERNDRHTRRALLERVKKALRPSFPMPKVICNQSNNPLDLIDRNSILLRIEITGFTPVDVIIEPAPWKKSHAKR